VHAMWPVFPDVPCSVVSVLGKWVSCAKTAVEIVSPFGMMTHGSKEPCIRWYPVLPGEGAAKRGDKMAIRPFAKLKLLWSLV